MITSFQTTVNDIPCICKVVYYRPYVPAKKFGYPENWEEEIPSEFDFELINIETSERDFLLEFETSEQDIDRLQDEYEAAVMADKHGKDF